MPAKRLLLCCLPVVILVVSFARFSQPLVIHAWSWPQGGMFHPGVDYVLTVEIYCHSVGPVLVENLYRPVESGTGIKIGPATTSEGDQLQGLSLKKGEVLTLRIPVEVLRETHVDHLALHYRYWGFPRELRFP